MMLRAPSAHRVHILLPMGSSHVRYAEWAHIRREMAQLFAPIARRGRFRTSLANETVTVVYASLGHMRLNQEPLCVRSAWLALSCLPLAVPLLQTAKNVLRELISLFPEALAALDAVLASIWKSPEAHPKPAANHAVRALSPRFRRPNLKISVSHVRLEHTPLI